MSQVSVMMPVQLHFCSYSKVRYLRTVSSREWWIFWRNWRNCLCSVLMSARDRQRLGVSGGVSVRAKCLMSHIHSKVCWLSYPLWSLAGRHVKRSMTALFSSRSFKRSNFEFQPEKWLLQHHLHIYIDTHTHTHTHTQFFLALCHKWP